MSHLQLKPAPGRLVRDPSTKKPLAESGERKPRTAFWLRRLRSGDVIDMNAPVEEDAPVEAEKGDTP